MASILLVEDDVDLGRMLANDLKRQDHTVLLVDSVDDALVQFDKTILDLVVTDLRMPGRDGLDLLKALQEISPQTPTILMSSWATARDYELAMRYGTMDVLSKPFTRAELQRAIQLALECKRGYRGLVHGLSLVDMLQMLHYGRRTVSVLVGSTGRICMRNGEVVDATLGRLEGETALRGLIACPAGNIRTAPLVSSRETISRRLDQLLLDLLRVTDESKARPDPSTNASTDESDFGDILDDHDNETVTKLEPVAETGLRNRAASILARGALANLPDTAVVISIRISDRRAVAIHGHSELVDVGGLLALLKACTAYVDDPVGSMAHTSAKVGIAMLWDQANDFLLTIVEPLASALDLSRFRTHSSALAQQIVLQGRNSVD